ncbi:surface lipoprotein assembly modifier [Ursidibacter sp. B-7004-1]
MRKLTLPLYWLPCLAFATPNHHDEQIKNVAKPIAPQAQPELTQTAQNSQPIDISLQELSQNPPLVHQLLSDALFARQTDTIATLLPVYQQFPNADKTLIQFAQAKLASLQGKNNEAIHLYRQILAEQPQLNVVRIELAIALFNAQQNNAAEDQFNKAKSAENLPAPVMQLIDAYLAALKKRSSWQFGASAYYVQENNINNTSNSPEIENTGYVKGESMLPRKANGFAYSADLSRDFNLTGSHYLTFQNDFSGRSYWNSHDDDELTNRTLLGYTYKNEKQTLRLLPFFEKRWSGGSSYRKTQGVRAEYNHWLSPNWQISTALEYGKQDYYDSQAQDGSSKLASITLLWLPKPQQYFYVGSDIGFERTKVRQFSADTKSLRFGWGQEWQTFGLSSRLGFAITERDYHDTAKLGNTLDLGKVRSDEVFSTTLILWKRDWHLFGITPKLQLSWRKHDSNLPTLYSYTDKNINVIFETRF